MDHDPSNIIRVRIADSPCVTARDLLAALREAEADRDREATARSIWKAKAREERAGRRRERQGRLAAEAAFDACYEELESLRATVRRHRRIVRAAGRAPS